MTLHCLFLTMVALTMVTASQRDQFGQDGGSSLLLQDPCVSKKLCSECLKTPRCAWCMQPDYLQPNNSGLPRCNREEFYTTYSSQCEDRYIVNPNNQFTIMKNVELRMSSSYMEAVQLKPQHVQLALRVNEAFDMDFYYEQAIDYPIDLYYLMDLSQSNDKEKLSKLGDLLVSTMQKVTSNFRLGFGSFVSTVAGTSGRYGYGYKHHMKLSTDTNKFAEEVRRAQVSELVNGPQGGLDAIMQAIVCTETIGWRNNTRKLLVFSSDAGLNHAGDGKFLGINTPNDGKCHLDSNGAYTHSDIQDYPSISQINRKVKDNSINLIFAVTQERMDFYNQLAESVEGSSVGTLSGDLRNVVSLVEAQYEAITSSIEMKDNSNSNIRITYFSYCLGDGAIRQTSKCSGLRVGDRVTFTAKIEVVKCPKDPREWKQLFNIYPVGINEPVLVDLEMICQCDCEKPANFGYEENSPQCNNKGTHKCGICECPYDSFGRNCECDADNLKLNGNLEDGCRPNKDMQTLCNNRGDCICGKCECYPSDVEGEEISGDFCECDNYSCDRHNGLLCSGPDHGECVCGQCSCNSKWDVEGYSACECRAGQETCITPHGEHVNKVCSGHGTCSCGECTCTETEEGQYSGKYCEECPTCPGRCEEWKPCVECQQFKSGEYMDGKDDYDENGVRKCDKCPFKPIPVDVVDNYVADDQRLCSMMDDDGCRIKFVYGYTREGWLEVWVQRTKECSDLRG